MTRNFLLSAAVLLSFWAAAPPANAQAMCGQRAEITGALDQKYAEKVVGMGLAGNGNVLEIFASTNGSWTILMTKPSGVTCVMSAGEAWETMQQFKVGTKT